MNRQNRSKLFFRAFFTILAVLVLVVIGAFCTYMLWEKAPDISDEAPAQVSAQPVKSDSGSDDTGTAFSTDRQDGVYTVLLVGNDDGNGNTDTIIVGKIDTVQHKMDFVSIPRDTLVNISWNIRKINAVYWGTVNSGGVGIDGLRQQVKNLLGFDVDCYAVIDLDVFIDTVDALGGIYFDVPCDMDYEDSSQNLYIHVKAGYQLLDGETAMGVVRFRSGYANGDLGRVEMQQKFLKAAASQFITLGNIPNVSKVTQILGDGMDTNLSAANIAFFLRQAVQCKSEDINFYTLPNSPDMVRGLSYTFVQLYDWLDMINAHLNPYTTPITAANVDIVYRSGGAICCTGELRGAWYYQDTSAEPEETPPADVIVEPSPSPDEPTPSPEPSDEPAEPTPEPEPTPTPEPEPSASVIIVGN